MQVQIKANITSLDWFDLEQKVPEDFLGLVRLCRDFEDYVERVEKVYISPRDIGILKGKIIEILREYKRVLRNCGCSDKDIEKIDKEIRGTLSEVFMPIGGEKTTRGFYSLSRKFQAEGDVENAFPEMLREWLSLTHANIYNCMVAAINKSYRTLKSIFAIESSRAVGVTPEIKEESALAPPEVPEEKPKKKK